MNRFVAAIGLLGVAGATLALALAGPLDPPAGPLTPTYKTLTEVEPRTALSQANTPGDADSIFRITQPGSYYLTGNLAGVAGKSGIEIAASNVTIDLGGFELRGMLGATAAVVTEGGRSGISLRNGSVQDWLDFAIDLRNASGGALSDLRVDNINATGIFVGDDYSITECIVQSGFDGIRAGFRATISHCNVSNTAIVGVRAGESSIIDSCIVSANGAGGIVAGDSAVITGCTASFNGIKASTPSQGIFAGDGSVITGCTSQNNFAVLTDAEAGMGFSTGERCLIKDCTASGNQGHGFRIATDCRITGCSSSNNGTGSTAAAIHVAGIQNQIDNNQVNSSDVGIQVAGPANIITANIARGNAIAFSFVANNIYGTIIDRRVPTTIPSTPAVNGFTAQGTLGTSDSTANFTY